MTIGVAVVLEVEAVLAAEVSLAAVAASAVEERLPAGKKKGCPISEATEKDL